MSSLIYGVGINDYNGTIKLNGKLLHQYQLWISMLRRCYSSKFQSTNQSYIGCDVENYLLSFSNFNDFIVGVKGYGTPKWHMDKDVILKGNKTYSRDAICFIPSEINNFMTKSNRTRGIYPIGVTYCTDRKLFRSELFIDGKSKKLGRYKSPEEAFLKYKEAKEDQAKVLANRWKSDIDKRVYKALINYIVEITD